VITIPIRLQYDFNLATKKMNINTFLQSQEASSQ